MKNKQLTKSIQLTELQISFIKHTLQHSKLEKGSEISENMIATFEKLHIDIINEMQKEKSITTKLTERELNILISKVAKGTSEENLENPDILVNRLFDKLGKLRSDLKTN